MGLAGVLDDDEPVFLRNFHDGIHVRRMPILVHGNDRFRLPVNGPLQQGNIERIGLGVDID